MATQISAQVLVSPQDVFSTQASQGTSLGAKATLGDGRSFRYCLAGGTSLVPGKLQQASAEDTTNYQNLAAAATAIGDIQVTFSTSTTVTANILAGGYLNTTTSTGAGYTYQISGNTATSGAAGLVVTLADPILVATTTATRFDLTPNPFSSVVVNPTGATSAPVGAAVFAITNAQYGWLQVSGTVGLLVDDQTVVVGTALSASNQAAGAVEPFAGVQAMVGIALTGGATTQYVQVALNLP